MSLYKIVARPILFRLKADTAHDVAIKTATYLNDKAWTLDFFNALYRAKSPLLHQNIWGLDFNNPVGLAAGFDKNGRTLSFMESLGFGYLEVGSVTANASPGNPRPTSFRLPEDRSLINRLGLNNDGAKTVTRRLKKKSVSVPVGVNIAKTHDPFISGEKALKDYKISYDLAKKVADYVTINISCPNTTEGKTFEDPETLNQLLSYLNIGEDMSGPPVLVKISVDTDDTLLTELLDICQSKAVDGYVATNTSSKRTNLSTSQDQLDQIGRGGLSGRAIKDRSTDVIRKIHKHTKGEKTIIGVGGVFTADDAIEKLKAGADLLQIYTGMVYNGPGIVKSINKGIVKYLKENGLENVYQLK